MIFFQHQSTKSTDDSCYNFYNILNYTDIMYHSFYKIIKIILLSGIKLLKQSPFTIPTTSVKFHTQSGIDSEIRVFKMAGVSELLDEKNELMFFKFLVNSGLTGRH